MGVIATEVVETGETHNQRGRPVMSQRASTFRIRTLMFPFFSVETRRATLQF